MKIIVDERGTGKTTRLINISAETGEYIVCHSMVECSRIQSEAHKMNLDIPLPICYDEFIRGKYYGKGIKGFLIDNGEKLIEYLSKGVPVNAITITNPSPTSVNK